MFQTTKVAKQIRQARIAINWTQMQLADAMGVSYQAVSNWERGNSMPDISKLEELCQVLNLSVEQLLGVENSESAAVTKLLTEQEPSLTVQELSELAPLMPPEEVKAQVKKQKLDISALAAIAPFLDDDVLEELVADLDVANLEENSLEALEALGPFLSETLLDELVRQMPLDNGEALMTLAPFLGEETLNWAVSQFDMSQDCEPLTNLGPFLSEESIDTLAQTQIAKGELECLEPLYPFMGKETLRKVVKAMLEQGNMEGLQEAAVFL